jgi:hypothetical protein
LGIKPLGTNKPKREAGFFTIEARSKLAEAYRKYGHKGRSARVVGWLREERWVDPDGKHRSKVVIVAVLPVAADRALEGYYTRYIFRVYGKDREYYDIFPKPFEQVKKLLYGR